MGYWCLIFPILSRACDVFNASTTRKSASLTKVFAKDPASEVKFTLSSIGTKIGRFLFAAISKSFSPLAGDRCTIPLPVEISTNSSATIKCIDPAAASSSNFGISPNSG